MGKVTIQGFGDRIKQLCDGRGISVRTAEVELGFANGYFLAIDKHGSCPSAKRLRMIADYFGVTQEYLLGESSPDGTTGVMIPLLGRVAAGLPITAVENIIGQEEIKKQLAATGEFFALRIRGNSMEPDIRDGDVVIVRQQDYADDGDVVIALINGDDGVCKSFHRSNGTVVLASKNPAYAPMVFGPNGPPLRILGRVIELRRSI